MTQENNKVVKFDESHKSQPRIDHSRRSFAKVGAIAPVIMTLTSKTALGAYYQCTISGLQSGNLSSHPGANDLTVCQTGSSPAEWANVDSADNSSGSTDFPNIRNWITANLNPFRVERQGNSYYIAKSASCNTPVIGNALAMAEAVFGAFTSTNGGNGTSACGFSGSFSYIEASPFSSIFTGGTSEGIGKVLLAGGVDADAAAAYLNAKFGKIDFTLDEVKYLWSLAKNGDSQTAMLLANLYIP